VTGVARVTFGNDPVLVPQQYLPIITESQYTWKVINGKLCRDVRGAKCTREFLHRIVLRRYLRDQMRPLLQCLKHHQKRYLRYPERKALRRSEIKHQAKPAAEQFCRLREQIRCIDVGCPIFPINGDYLDCRPENLRIGVTEKSIDIGPVDGDLSMWLSELFMTRLPRTTCNKARLWKRNLIDECISETVAEVFDQLNNPNGGLVFANQSRFNNWVLKLLFNKAKGRSKQLGDVDNREDAAAGLRTWCDYDKALSTIGYQDGQIVYPSKGHIPAVRPDKPSANGKHSLLGKWNSQKAIAEYGAHEVPGEWKDVSEPAVVEHENPMDDDQND
jgi:hypothetical protein